MRNGATEAPLHMLKLVSKKWGATQRGCLAGSRVNEEMTVYEHKKLIFCALDRLIRLAKIILENLYQLDRFLRRIHRINSRQRLYGPVVYLVK